MPLRSKLLVVFLFLALIAAAPPEQLAGIPVELKTQDGWTIRGVYQKQKKGSGKTVVLFHGLGRSKEQWYSLARGLKRGGYGYLAVDIRGHGNSSTGPDGEPASWRKFRVTKAENDFVNMPYDVQAAIDYLKVLEISEDSIVLVGDDIGGLAALTYAVARPKLSMIAMITPLMVYRDIPSVVRHK